MQTFGGKEFFVDLYPRSNFDTLWNAAMSVFVVISGDNWPQPLSAGFRALGWSGCIYFIVLVAVGSWVALKLFLAILLGAFDEEHEEEEEEEREAASKAEAARDEGEGGEDGEEMEMIRTAKKEDVEKIDLTKRDVALAVASDAGMKQERVLRAMGAFDARLHYATVLELQAEDELRRELVLQDEERNKNVGGVHLETKHEMPPFNALYVFSPSNRMRQSLFELVTSVAYELFIFSAIAASCVFVAVDNSYWRNNQTWQTVQSGAELCFLLVFGLEMVFKIIAFGLVLHKGAYWRDPWNVLDFVVVCLSVISIILGSVAGIDLSFLRGLRAFRAFRLLGRFQTTRTTVTALFKSIPAVINVVLFSVFIW